MLKTEAAGSEDRLGSKVLGLDRDVNTAYIK